VNCEQLYMPLHRYADGESPPNEARAVERHIADCVKCRDLLLTLRRENELIEEHFDTAAAPDDIDLRFATAEARIDSHRRARRLSRWLPLAAALVVVTILGVFVLRSGPTVVANIDRVSGDVAIRRAGSHKWDDLSGRSNVVIYDGDIIRTQEDHIAAIRFADACAVEIGRKTSLSFRRSEQEKGHRWHLDYGRIRCEIPRADMSFEVITPAGRIFGSAAGLHVSALPLDDTAAIPAEWQPRETGFSLLRSACAAGPSGAWKIELTVLWGTVTISNRLGDRRVPAGTTTRMTTTLAPSVPRSADVADVLRWGGPSTNEQPDIEPIILPPPQLIEEPSPENEPGDNDNAAQQAQEKPQPAIQPPLEIETSVGLDSITISWKPAATAKLTLHYDVYRSDELAGAEGNFIKINKEPIKATSFVDKTFSYAASYYYAVVAVGRKEAVEVTEGPGQFVDSYLSERVKVRAPDFTIMYVGGNSELAVIMIRKYHRGYWRPTTFYTKIGSQIGGSRLMRLPDGLGGVEEVEFATGYRLVEIKDSKGPAGTMSIVISDGKGHRYELKQQRPRRQ